MTGSCCNGGCENINSCNCYAYNPNYKYHKLDLTESLIRTGLQCFDSDSIRTRQHGKECLQQAIDDINKFIAKDLIK